MKPTNEMMERAFVFCDRAEWKSPYGRNLLAEFGQAERARAVRECAEALRRHANGSQRVDVEASAEAILAVAKPEPVWCDHCHFISIWWCRVDHQYDVPLEHWHQFCPVCGEAKPKA